MIGVHLVCNWYVCGVHGVSVVCIVQLVVSEWHATGV